MLLPTIKPYYAQEELDKFSPIKRLAAYYGVQSKFLYFAEDPEYLEDPEEMYSIHKFSGITINGLKLDAQTQFENALALLGNGELWSPSIIVINTPNFIFKGTKDSQGAEGFLSHLLCSLAMRVQKRKAPSVEVNFLEIMQIDHAKGYQMKPRHILIWGPCTEHFSSYDCNRTIQFLFSFRNHTRILLTSTTDLGSFLEKFHLSAEAVSYIFNLDTGIPREPKKEIVAKERKKKARTVSLSI